MLQVEQPCHQPWISRGPPLEFARAGAGIIRITQSMVSHDLASGRLVRLLSDYEFENMVPIYVAYVTRRHLSPKVRVFIDYLASHLEAGRA